MKRITIAVAALALAVPAAAQATASAPAAGQQASAAQRGEVRITGTVTKLTATRVVVANAARTVRFTIPSGFNLGTVKVGSRVQAEGERAAGKLVLRTIHREDAPLARRGADDKPGHDAGDDHGHHGGGHR
jgi:Cu/Ag efflux protein CusF